MARWKALPAGLDPAVLDLVVHLRRMKDDSGLSLPQLAARTGSSASSWERYLAGRTLPPQRAVAALAGITGADAVRLEVLREAAAEAWQRTRPTPAGQAAGPAAAPEGGDARTAPAGGEADTVLLPAEAGSEPPLRETPAAPPVQPAPSAGIPAAGASPDGPPPGEETGSAAAPATARPGLPAAPAQQRRTWPGPDLRTAAVVLASALAGALITLLAVQPWRSSPANAAPAAVPVARQSVYACSYTRRGGLWYAGNSSTSTANLVVDMSGPEVAELQCLLQRVGMQPGGIDGNFGPLTELAVIKAQKFYGLGVDGQVGPQTWKALRR